MPKQKARRRPDIQSVQLNVKHDEHQLCATPGCRNVVAIWSKHKVCSLCRL
jgi:hypothetical protein